VTALTADFLLSRKRNVCVILCGMPQRINLVGLRFGRLVVLKIAQYENRKRYWHCRCDCGTEKTIVGDSLRGGLTRSCGCLTRDLNIVRQTTHGKTHASIYGVWKSMRLRCDAPTNRAYKNYGGRGIKVCDRWRTFENFLADMGEPPPGLTIERVDNDGDYAPGNCRWASYREQSRNRQKTYRLTVCGEYLSLPDACEKYGIRNSGYVSNRAKIFNIPVAEAFFMILDQAVLGGNKHIRWNYHHAS
jgi:hypothetical protein